ncbi:MAG: SDR family NAD(P)-dependent oxidoreductase [Nitrososphaerales archaeon]
MSGKVALITGAASGIGRHWAQALVREGGWRLALADIDDAGLAAAFAPGADVRLRHLDIRSPQEWQAVVDDTVAAFARIDYLFNIAGGGRPAFLLDLPLSDVDFGIDVNLKGPLYGMKLAADAMARQGSGHIINVGSLAGVAATPGNLVYSAAKAGLRHASLAAAVELRKSGISVTLICPDLVDTPLVHRNRSKGAAAALAFSGAKPLSVADMEAAFRRAMRDRPLQIELPRYRGWLARANNAFPRLMPLLYEPLKRRGLAKIAEAQRKETA